VPQSRCVEKSSIKLHALFHFGIFDSDFFSGRDNGMEQASMPAISAKEISRL